MASNFDPNVPLATNYKDNSVIKFFIIKDVDGKIISSSNSSTKDGFISFEFIM